MIKKTGKTTTTKRKTASSRNPFDSPKHIAWQNRMIDKYALEGERDALKRKLAKALKPEKYKIVVEYPNGTEAVAIFNAQGDAFIAASALMKAAPSSHRYYIVPIKRKSL